MDTLKIILMGIVQGLTEFLPISSSGHLVLIRNFFQIQEPVLILNISLHVGTLIAVFIILHKEIISILKTLIKFPMLIKKYGSLKQTYLEDKKAHLIILLIIGSTPTAIIGFFLKNFVNNLFGSPHLVGFMLLVSGSILWVTKKLVPSKKNILKTQIKDSLIIGTLQGISIIPGISRSGLTISAGLLLGMNRELSGQFSFLLSIPAILGALILTLCSPNLQANVSINLIFTGSIISAIVGCIALRFMLLIIKSKQLYMFTPYCYTVGLLTIVSNI